MVSRQIHEELVESFVQLNQQMQAAQTLYKLFWAPKFALLASSPRLSSAPAAIMSFHWLTVGPTAALCPRDPRCFDKKEQMARNAKGLHTFIELASF